jgi:hypothetical protein
VEFFAIMFVGAVIAVWAVAGSRPTRRFYTIPPPLNLPEADDDQRNAQTWQWQPMDEVEYLKALELNESDPKHNPAPSPIPSKT